MHKLVSAFEVIVGRPTLKNTFQHGQLTTVTFNAKSQHKAIDLERYVFSFWLVLCLNGA